MTPSQDDIDEIKEIWQWIRWWKEKLRLTIEELAFRAKCKSELITRGINGEPVPIRHILPNFVVAFGLDLQDGEPKPYEGLPSYRKLYKGVPLYDECKKLLKPSRELTPGEKLPPLHKY
ncbi:MAG: hypothetical protein HY529_02805 [Chloroflexi bacterium]|nr:hypothetical protein [Chloroflexota bacterium]